MGFSAAVLRYSTPPLTLKCPAGSSHGGWGGTNRPWAASGTPPQRPDERVTRAARATARMGELEMTSFRAKRKAGPGLRGRPGERATGFEPATSSLGSWHSTPELRPRGYGYITYTIELAV